MWSHREGVLFQPDEQSTYYLSHGTSFNASGDLYQFDARTVNTPPEQSRNYELGAKWELLNGDLSMRTALFRTIKYNRRNTDAASASPTNYLLNGQRHPTALSSKRLAASPTSWKCSPRWPCSAASLTRQATPPSTARKTTKARPQA